LEDKKEKWISLSMKKGSLEIMIMSRLKNKNINICIKKKTLALNMAVKKEKKKIINMILELFRKKGNKAIRIDNYKQKDIGSHPLQ
jgi:hypothetical protein